jgi:hypothetical protein
MSIWNGHHSSLMFALDAMQVTKHEVLTTDFQVPLSCPIAAQRNIGFKIPLPYRCFPRHEIIERSSSFILNKFDDTCVIDEAEKRGLIRNQIEWVH